MKVIMECWDCGNHHDMTDRKYERGIKCDCGGYVVTPSGKVQAKIVYDEATAYGNDCVNGSCE